MKKYKDEKTKAWKIGKEAQAEKHENRRKD